ncbi:MAG: FHA domain-containing protein [Pirellulaceae bacterium]|nr:FHA domain-containing protein [Pirellulaceae bacterium]
MHVRLKILQGSNAGKEIKLPMPKCLIGRDDGCHLRPQAEAVSRKHCVIITTDTEVAVRDLNSRNGTYVNGERIAEDTVLLSGDVLRVGPLEFEMQIENTAAKIKRPKVEGIKEVVGRTAESSSHSTGDLSDVTSWLEEGDQADRQRKHGDPDTRQFRVEDTSAPPDTISAKKEAVVGDTTALPPDAKRPEKKPPGKLPPRQTIQSKDSREAAADMLKKFFNRR